MEIKKGTILNVKDSRSGNWKGIATKDFDTVKDEWYPIALAEGTVDGISTIAKWEAGDDMPARNGLCTVEVAK